MTRRAAHGPITVLSVDDQAVVREGYHRLLARDSSLKVKLGASSALQLIIIARQMGLN